MTTIFLLTAIAAIPAYLLGSVNGAIITSQVFYRKDIRQYGSGNPGLTNFYRVFGSAGVLLVIFIDVLKTVAPIVFGGWLLAHFTNLPVSENWLFRHFFDISLFGIISSGFFVMLGHCFPVFYRFNGGKGVLAIGAVVIVIDWRLALICWAIFLLIVLTTRYVSLGSMIACCSMPFFQFFVLGIGGVSEFIVTILCAALVVIRHKENIKKLVSGKESKLNLKREKKE